MHRKCENNQITANKLSFGNCMWEISMECLCTFTDSVLVWAFAWCSCSLITEHSYKTSALPDVDPTKHRSKLEVASQLRWAFIPLQTVCELCKDCSQTGKSLQLFRATELARHTVKVSIHSSVSRGTLYRSQTLLVGAASPNLVF